MGIHHDTSFRSILEDDSISSTFKTHICFCLGKGVRLWLIVRSSIHSFRIAHSTFILVLHFCFNLIRPSPSSLFTCECEHELDASNMHLTRCPFEGQWMTTHDTIQDVMYAFTQENGHDVWKKWWYALC
jgi:hypothetical protein